MWVRIATYEGGDTEKLRAMAEQSGPQELAPGMTGGTVFATADGRKRLFLTYFDSKESLDAAAAYFEQMGAHVPEDVGGRSTSVEAYEVVMNPWER